MAYTSSFVPEILTPSAADIEAMRGPVLLEFGTSWCGFCRGAQPLIEQAAGEFPLVQHIKVEDGPGRPLGRNFKVKLWPTLVFLRDGKPLAQLVRPTQVQEIRDALQLIAS
ncbi:MAG: thioredoxin family protein [Comamonadaceae bacterium]|nr:thioredoxin family protein [Comamonadaceae bacterium]